MRRLLRDIATGRNLGDTTTLADATVVDEIKRRASEAPPKSDLPRRRRLGSRSIRNSLGWLSRRSAGYVGSVDQGGCGEPFTSQRGGYDQRETVDTTQPTSLPSIDERGRRRRLGGGPRLATRHDRAAERSTGGGVQRAGLGAVGQPADPAVEPLRALRRRMVRPVRPAWGEQVGVDVTVDHINNAEIVP